MTQKMKALFHRHREALLYLIFGVLTTAVNYAVYLLCRRLLPHGDYTIYVNNSIAWVVAVLFAWVTNRVFVFGSTARGRDLLRELASFGGARVLSLLLEQLMLFAGVSLLQLDDRLVKLAANVVVIVVNYFLSKFIIFRKKT